MPTEEEWIEDTQVSADLRAKTLALKVCRHRCLALAESDEALEIATPVLRMLITLIQHNGSFTADASDR